MLRQRRLPVRGRGACGGRRRRRKREQARTDPQRRGGSAVLWSIEQAWSRLPAGPGPLCRGAPAPCGLPARPGIAPRGQCRPALGPAHARPCATAQRQPRHQHGQHQQQHQHDAFWSPPTTSTPPRPSPAQPNMAPSPPYPVLSSDEQRPVRGLPIRSVRERRLGEFVGGQYNEYNLAALLFEARTDSKHYIRISRWDPVPWLHPHPDGKGGDVINKPPFADAAKQTYTPTHKGTTFGPSWTNHWVKVQFTVPPAWAGREEGSVQLEFDPDCEAMIFNDQGLPLQGLTGGGDVNRRVDFPLTTSMCKAGRETTLFIEITANGMGGLPPAGSGKDPDPNRYFELRSADLVLKRLEAWRLLWDFNLLRGSVDWVDRSTVLQNKALWVANEIQNTFRHTDVGSVARCRALAQEVLGGKWDTKPEAIWTQPTNTSATVWAMGHCHIDSCWLWPKKITQQKVARSWSTQLSLMERYPEHRFTASQAAQFVWLEKLYPSLFERLKKFIASGQFIPVGGTWVENDANLPSGEAFVRQFVHGQRYFLSRFGARSNIFWLPDTFGYNAQIPQLARSAGLDYFFTQKLSWNNINHYPHNTVMWEGLDGSQIITHFSPVENYDSQCRLDDITKCMRNSV